LKCIQFSVHAVECYGVIKFYVDATIFSGKILYPALSIAFLFTVFLGGYFFFNASPDRNIKVPSSLLISKTEVKSNEPLTIKLRYTAVKDVKNVSIDIKLDNAITFYSMNRKLNTLQKTTWKGEFKKGLNEIPFAVSVKEKGEWSIDTEAFFDGFIHPHKITITATDEKTVITYFKLPAKRVDEL